MKNIFFRKKKKFFFFFNKNPFKNWSKKSKKKKIFLKKKKKFFFFYNKNPFKNWSKKSKKKKMNTNIQKFEISFLMLTYISIQIGFVLLKKFRLYNDRSPLRIISKLIKVIKILKKKKNSKFY